MASAVAGTTASRNVAPGQCPSQELTPQHELELVARWQDQRDRRALSILVEACTPRIDMIARRYRHYPVQHEDLVGEGHVGFITAIDRFDRTRGVRLMTYASFWIRAFMVRFITADWGRGKTGLGITRTKIFFKMRRERARQQAGAVDEDTMIENLSQCFSLSSKSINRLLDALEVREFSIDAYADAGGRSDTIGCTDLPEAHPYAELETLESQTLFESVIGRVLPVLKEREALVVTERFMADDPISYAELGRRLGVSRERVRQIENGILRKLRAEVSRSGFTRGDFRMAVA